MDHVQLPLTPGWLYWPEPWVWILLLTLLLPVYWLLGSERRNRAAVRFSSLSLLQTLGPRGGRIRAVLPALRMVALLSLIVACARPQRPDESTHVYSEGIAIQLVVDTSGSMQDVDLSQPGKRQSRLDVVKEVVKQFVNGGGGLMGRPNDLVGLVRFARYADSVCPLTLDHAAVIDVLNGTPIVTAREEDGTAIGDGLALAVERLRELKRTAGSGEQVQIKSRIVILLTDGENNYGMISPEDAGNLAATQGIKVYTIMAGTGRLVMQGMRVPEDDRDLRKIAEVSGGKFFKARDADSLRAIYEQIDKLERTKVEEQRYVAWQELSLPWVLTAFAAIALQALLDATLLRKTP